MPATAPFQCTYTASFADLLQQLGISLALSTYQAGKVIMLSPGAEPHKLVQLPRSFKKAMGIAVDGNRLAVATLDEVLVLVNSPELAWHYPPNPGVYDALYMPRATYFTGQLDIHDLEWGANGLYGVNTSFSCLCKIDEHYSFTPIWQPPFISKLAAEDRCHLNGMAMHNGQPAYATAFGPGDSPKSWRESITTSGLLLAVPSGEVVAQGLPMPHSPRLYPEGLFLALSGAGQLVQVDLVSGQLTSILHYPGFLRGIDRWGDYLFVGVSQVRKSSKTFAKLDPRLRTAQAGVLAVHLPSGQLVGQLQYQQSVEEIYDVRVLPGQRRPNLLNTDKPEHKLGLAIPQTTYWAPSGQP